MHESRSDLPWSLAGLQQTHGIRGRELSRQNRSLKFLRDLPTRAVLNSVSAASSDGFRWAIEKSREVHFFSRRTPETSQHSGLASLLNVPLRACIICVVKSLALAWSSQCNKLSTSAETKKTWFCNRNDGNEILARLNLPISRGCPIASLSGERPDAVKLLRRGTN